MLCGWGLGCGSGFTQAPVRGLFQGQKQNADVFIQEIDGVARIFPELSLEDLRFVVP